MTQLGISVSSKIPVLYLYMGLSLPWLPCVVSRKSRVYFGPVNISENCSIPGIIYISVRCGIKFCIIRSLGEFFFPIIDTALHLTELYYTKLQYNRMHCMAIHKLNCIALNRNAQQYTARHLSECTVLHCIAINYF